MKIGTNYNRLAFHLFLCLVFNSMFIFKKKIKKDLLGLLQMTQTHKYFPTRDVTWTIFLRKKILLQFACVLEVYLLQVRP